MPLDDLFVYYWTTAQQQAASAARSPAPAPSCMGASEGDGSVHWMPAAPGCSRRDSAPSLWPGRKPAA